MLYIDVFSSLNHLDVFTCGRDDDISPASYEEVKNECYSKDDGWDVYSLCFCPGGYNSVNHEDIDAYFSIDTKASLFDLARVVCDENMSHELFCDWCASRRGNDYFLNIRLITVRQEILDERRAILSKWIAENGKLINTEPFEFCFDAPSPCREVSTLDLISEDIVAFEKSEYANIEGIDWNIDFPEYEGGGEFAQLFFDHIDTLLSILVPLGISRISKQSIIKNKKRIDKSREMILRHENITGHLVDPSLNENRTDKNGNTVYCFYELIDEDIVALYYATATIVKGKEIVVYSHQNLAM